MIGIGAAVLFQLIFFSVWLTGYKGVEDRTDQLTVGWVQEDEEAGTSIYDSLRDTLPFKITSYASFAEAKDALNGREIQMLIQLPEQFTQDLQSGATPSIHYWVNSATSSAVKTIMEKAANEIGKGVNDQVFVMKAEAFSHHFEQQVKQLPIEDPVAGALQEAVTGGAAVLSATPVRSKVHNLNDPGTFSANLVPLMVIISSFVGAMVMIMQVGEAASGLIGVSKWGLFWSRQLLNGLVAFALPLLTLGLLKLFGVEIHESVGMVYLFQAILYLTFLSYAQVFVYVFGNAGMVFNILALSLQLVTSGVLVSKELLSTGYQKLATVLPATYGADGYFTIAFGGPDGALTQPIQSLLLILGVTVLVTVVTVLLKKPRRAAAV